MRLLELKDEIIGLADGDIFGAVLVALTQGGRQRPYAVDPILRIAGIAIDFGRSNEHEAGLLRQRNCVVLAHVAIPALGVLRHIITAAMLLDSKNATGFQRSEARRQRL